MEVFIAAMHLYLQSISTLGGEKVQRVIAHSKGTATLWTACASAVFGALQPLLHPM